MAECHIKPSWEDVHFIWSSHCEQVCSLCIHVLAGVSVCACGCIASIIFIKHYVTADSITACLLSLQASKHVCSCQNPHTQAGNPHLETGWIALFIYNHLLFGHCHNCVQSLCVYWFTWLYFSFLFDWLTVATMCCKFLHLSSVWSPLKFY